MAYFKCGSGSGSSVTIDDVVYEGDLKLKSVISDVKLPNTPYNSRFGSVVVLDGEIHLIGGEIVYSDNANRNHYKFNGSSWSKVSTLPYDFEDGSAVVLNGEIHIFGGGYTHY